LEGGQQVIPQGPVAALEFIKNLGTNGGGFFNANGAHPYENPTPLSNFIELLAIVPLPAAFTNTFGRMIGEPRQGWVLFAVMVALFVTGLLLCGWSEQRGNTGLARLQRLSVHLQRGMRLRVLSPFFRLPRWPWLRKQGELGWLPIQERMASLKSSMRLPLFH
jgi:K+-transporting ATPase A subunit